MKAIDVLLQFYKPNRELTGNVDLLERYLELQEKGELEAELSNVFAKQNEKGNEAD